MFRHVPLMLTCAELDGFLVDYFDGTLPRAQQRIFALHLLLCRECRSYLAGYRRTVALGQAVFTEPMEPVPADVPEALVRAILDARLRSS
jgi:anti-sigma factor RsiW